MCVKKKHLAIIVFLFILLLLLFSLGEKKWPYNFPLDAKHLKQNVCCWAHKLFHSLGKI